MTKNYDYPERTRAHLKQKHVCPRCRRTIMGNSYYYHEAKCLNAVRESIEWRMPDAHKPPCQTNLLGVFDDADDNRWIAVCYLDGQGQWHELSASTYEGPQMWMLVHAPTLWSNWPEGPTVAE